MLKIDEVRQIILIIVLCSVLITCTNQTKPPSIEDNFGWTRIDLDGKIFPGAISSDRFYVAYENGVAIFEDITSPPNIDVKIDIDNQHNIVIYAPPWITKKFIAYHPPSRSYSLTISDFIDNNSIRVGSSNFDDLEDDYLIHGVIQGFNLDSDKSIYRFYSLMTKIGYICPLYITYFDVYLDNDNNISLNNLGCWEFLSNNAHLLASSTAIRYKNMVLLSYFTPITTEPGLAVLYDDLSFKNLDQSPLTYVQSFWVWNEVIYAQKMLAETVYSSEDGENWNYFGNFDMEILCGVEVDNYLFFYNIQSGFRSIYFLEEVNGDIYVYQVPSNFTERINSINRYQDYLVVTTTSAIYYKLYDELINKRTFQRILNIGEKK